MKSIRSLLLIGLAVALSSCPSPLPRGFSFTVFHKSQLVCIDSVAHPDQVRYRVLPGTSVALKNPCATTLSGTIDGKWILFDTFTLTNSLGLPLPAGIQVNVIDDKTQPFNPPVRNLVATPGVALFVDRPIAYFYSNSVGEGQGFLLVTTAAPLTVSVAATPAKINAGQSSQLVATVTGGVPPYSFAWTCDSSLNPCNIAKPLATPTTTTTYAVSVTDAAGERASASATVTVASSTSQFTLTVVNTNPNGGLVVGQGILCGGGATQCTAVYAKGTTVPLFPDVFTNLGFTFGGWQGCDIDAGIQGCTVVMNNDRTVTVSFR